MKKLYFLFFLTIGFLANAQIVNIPDANFKTVLLGSSQYNYIAKDLSGNYFAIDSNNDSEIQISEALNVSYLEINSFNISYLQGIEFFTNLQVLNCSYNYLSELIIDDLINLRDLNCSNNQITSLDLSNNLLLQMLNCGLNQISFLNINNLSNLEQLICTGNQISDLNLSWLINLQYLYCTSNQLTNLDLTNLINLQALYCSSNQITQLNLEDSNNLIELICEYNELISLNVKNGNVNNWYNLFFDGNPNLQYICTDESDVSFIQSKINTYGYTNCHVNSYCSFTPGGTFYEISGTTKLDSNNNGCDILDINYSNLRFNITNGTVTGSTISNQTGNYYIPVQAGNHTITPNLENPSYFNISPTSFTVNFPTQASPFTQNFCVTANGVKSDVEVVILSTVPARPGFDAKYKISYRNKGNQVENGNVSITFDDTVLDYVSSNPTFDSSATNSYTWNYTNLQPFETREIEIVFNVNSPMETPAVNNGDVLNYTATITTSNTDLTLNDNTFTLDQTVVGSYDPNDKTCLEGTTIKPSEVGNYVHYLIRFENTGTYQAQNIVVKDMINLSKFDISTLVPLKGSHDYFTKIKDNKVEFIFENINLDFNDATNDGYVAFKIKTLPSLVLGEAFSNQASIFFDYNFPIITNTYTTTVEALSNQDFDFSTYYSLYPNPAKDALHIHSKQGIPISSIEVYNQLGQIVLAVPTEVSLVDVSNLASGTYFVKINTEKGSANTKFVKK